MFLRRQTGPRGQVAAQFERAGIDLDRQRQCGDRTDAGDGGQALADRIGFVRGGQPSIDVSDLGVERLDLLAQNLEHGLGFGWNGGLLFNNAQQDRDLAAPVAGDHAEFRGMTAHRVAQLGPLIDQGPAYLQHHSLGLLVERLHRHEMHAGTPARFADRRGVVAVILAAFDIRRHVLRRDQMHLVAERGQFPGPMMAAATGFQGNLGGRQLGEEVDHLPAAQIEPQRRPLRLIDAVQREHGFGRVDGNAFILGHGRLRSWLFTAPSLARDAVGPSTPTMTEVHPTR